MTPAVHTVLPAITVSKVAKVFKGQKLQTLATLTNHQGQYFLRYDDYSLMLYKITHITSQGVIVSAEPKFHVIQD